MPSHSYVCHACGHAFEAGEARLEERPCPSCGADEVYRDFGNIGIHFKGEGWTPASHSSPSEPMVSRGTVPIRDEPAVVSDGKDLHGEKPWVPGSDVIRRGLRKMGYKPDARGVAHAEKQMRVSKPEADAHRSGLQKVAAERAKAETKKFRKDGEL